MHENIGVPHVGVQATSRYQIREHKSASQFLRTRLYKQLKAAHAQKGKRTLAPPSSLIQMCYHLSNDPAILRRQLPEDSINSQDRRNYS